MANEPERSSDDRLSDAYHDEWLVIEGPLDNGYSLREPVPVHVFREGPEFVAALEDPAVTGFGATPSDALEDLRTEIIEHLRTLEAAGGNLTPRMKRERDRLTTLVH